jgi:hypothetical protein
MTPREFLQVTDALNLRSTFGLVRRADSEQVALDSPKLRVRGDEGRECAPPPRLRGRSPGRRDRETRGLLACASGGSRAASGRAETLGMVASWDAVTRRCAGDEPRGRSRRKERRVREHRRLFRLRRPPLYRVRFTVTTKVAVLLLPLVSIAEQRTCVRPTLNQLPDLGLQVTGRLPSTSSWALTE